MKFAIDDGSAVVAFAERAREALEPLSDQDRSPVAAKNARSGHRVLRTITPMNYLVT